MPIIIIIVSGLLMALVRPAPADAWGFEAHRYIMDRAIDLLPPELRPFYDRHRAFIVERAVDPDLWRTAGFFQEGPRHFMNLDAYGEYPFPDLPRSQDAAVSRYGRAHVDRHGVLPWRVEEMHRRLTRAFEQQRSGSSSFALDDIRFFSAVVAHYISDATVPFHALMNHDGQLTDQHGIHSRFETELFLRHRDLLVLKPRTAAAVTDARDFTFDALLESFRLAQPILDADRRASAGREFYDDAYFDRFFASTRPILEQRLGDAISGVASLIAGAWEVAGKPELPTDPGPRAPRRVGRPSR